MKLNLSLKASLPLFSVTLLGIALATLPQIVRAEDDVLLPTRNAFILAGAQADHVCNVPFLQLAGRKGSGNRKIYLQFELEKNTAKITGATLRLNIKDVFAGEEESVDGSFPFKVFAAANTDPNLWDESSITWNNAPGNTAGATEAAAPWVEVGRAEVSLPLKDPAQPVEADLSGLPGLLAKEHGLYLTLILVPDVQDAKAPGVVFYPTGQKAEQAKNSPALILKH